ncbi:MAG: zinc-dependent alcohol dehydrogenase family protein [Breznakia sp.]
MKAGMYLGDFTYEVQDISDRDPVNDEVKIKVAWCGLCGTDIHKYQGKNGASVVKPPIILGHECSGVVVEVGPDAKDYQIGDRVVCNPSFGCGKCSWCQEGLPNFCIDRHGVAKGFAEYVYPPEANVYHVPDNLDLESAAFAEPLSCAIHGMDLLEIKSGKTVVLYGLGAVGSLMLQLINLTGPHQIIVVEKEIAKKEIALKLGADEVVDDMEIVKRSNAINIDYVIECIGLKKTMEQSIEIAGKNSKVLLFGLGNEKEKIEFNQFEAYTKELRIFTSYLNPLVTKRAIDLLASGRIDTKSIISAEFDLYEMKEEFKTLNNARKGKVMVRLSGIK